MNTFSFSRYMSFNNLQIYLCALLIYIFQSIIIFLKPYTIISSYFLLFFALITWYSDSTNWIFWKKNSIYNVACVRIIGSLALRQSSRSQVRFWFGYILYFGSKLTNWILHFYLSYCLQTYLLVDKPISSFKWINHLDAAINYRFIACRLNTAVINCCIEFVDSFECVKMHGPTSPKCISSYLCKY